MKEFQAVVVRLQGRSGDDEEAITDLLNERVRMGWEFRFLTPVDPTKLIAVFIRET